MAWADREEIFHLLYKNHSVGGAPAKFTAAQSVCLGEKSLSGGLSISRTLHGHTDSLNLNYQNIKHTSSRVMEVKSQ